MGNDEFHDKVVSIVAKKAGLEKNQIYVVWMVKVLGNNKALASTSVDGDGLYYEVTYNGTSDEFYLDEYNKTSNEAIKNY